jgi:hypothetical protein
MLLTSILLLSIPTFPLTRTGSTCPLGYYTQAGYCVPTPSPVRQAPSINSSGSTCPLGTYRNGSYCTQTRSW